MTSSRIIRGTADDGCPIVRVPVARLPGVCVTMDAADLDSWLADGRSLKFYLNGGGWRTTSRIVYYRPDVAGHMSGVARDLLGLTPGRIVKFIDGNRLNLRRNNLGVTEGRARGQSPALRPEPNNIAQSNGNALSLPVAA